MKALFRVGRFILFAGGGVALLVGMYAGLIRIGWDFPAYNPHLVVAHGPLMVCGFLGSLISLERAVALKRRWAFLAPLFTAVGAVMLVFAPDSELARVLITVGSLFLIAIFVWIVRLQPAFFNVVMTFGAIMWFVGNVLWAQDHAIAGIVPWWIGFLLLTITGERLELSRMVRVPPMMRTLFGAILLIFIAGVAWTLSALFEPEGDVISFTRFGNAFTASRWLVGVRVAGLAIAGAGAWLLLFDMARKTLKMAGLARFVAASLMIGYVWLIITGILWIIAGPVAGGVMYDAVLHSFFLGFVISMVFAHAPIIFPAVFETGGTRYSPLLYGHLALLHFSLIVRVLGDLAGWPLAREWGGMLNVVAVLLFMPYHALARPEKPRQAR